MRYFIKDSDFLILKRAHDALVREWEVVKREFYARKFNPNQPRVSAGNPDGGQWMSEGGFSTPRLPDASIRAPAPYHLAATGKQSAAYCWNQMRIDMLYCATRPAPINAACRAQAMERYSACLSGKILPPLPF